MHTTASPPEDLLIEPENPDALFETLEKVGEGGSGCVVRKVRHRGTDEILCAKVVPVTAKSEELDGIKKEIAILHQCRHPNIVTYRGTYWSHSQLWVCMEFCAGGSTDRFYSTLGHPLTESCIAYIMHEVLVGLEYLHTKKVVHRDVKGSNILITEAGGVKLADFGVSAQLKHTLSRRNSSVGTLHWMAPEAIQEKDYDERADIWSLGITLIELAEGAPPHFELFPLRAIFMIPRSPPPVLNEKGAWTPKMHNFLARCVTKDPSQRPTAKQLLEDPFIRDAPNAAMELVEIIAACRDREPSVASAKPEQTDFEDEVPPRAPLHRDEPSSDDEDLTFVDNHRDGSATAVAAKRSSPLIAEGTFAKIPLVNLDEMTIDELCARDFDNPTVETASKILQVSVGDDWGRSSSQLTYTSARLLQCYHHHRSLLDVRKVTKEEEQRSRDLCAKYSTILRATLHI